HAPVFTPTSHHSLHSPSTGDAIEHEQQPNAIPQGHSPLLKTESHQLSHTSITKASIEHQQQHHAIPQDHNPLLTTELPPPSYSSSSPFTVQVDGPAPDLTHNRPANQPSFATTAVTNRPFPNCMPAQRRKPRERSSVIGTRSKSSTSTVFHTLPN
ncbi:MAG: hypothetical protein Q9180_008274, partial [Flavoplaca navasiana]